MIHPLGFLRFRGCRGADGFQVVLSALIENPFYGQMFRRSIDIGIPLQRPLILHLPACLGTEAYVRQWRDEDERSIAVGKRLNAVQRGIGLEPEHDPTFALGGFRATRSFTARGPSVQQRQTALQ